MRVIYSPGIAVRLQTVVARARQTHGAERLYLFANSTGSAYTRSGWGSVWQDAMFEWIASFDQKTAKKLADKKEWEAQRRKNKQTDKLQPNYSLIDHPSYFSLLDVRPAAITTKLRNRSADAYDFAAHANPSTTHRHYDRRKVKEAGATE